MHHQRRVFAILFCSVLLCSPVYSKTEHSTESVKAAFVFNFLKFIEWPSENSIEAVRIGFLGDDEAYFEEVARIQNQTIRGKVIVVHKIKRPSDINKFHVIVTARDQNAGLTQTANALHGQQTLLISDGAANKQLTMINFTYPDKDRVGFEVNRYNLVYEKLRVSPDILVLGGTEIDIAELIREMEANLQTSQRQLRVQADRLTQIQDEVAKREKKLAQQSQDLDKLKKEVSDKEKQITKQNQKIQQQDADLAKQTAQLESTKASFEKLKSELVHLDQALDQSRKQLQSSNTRLSKTQEEISAKESSISDLSKLIERNKQLLSEQNQRIRRQSQAIRKQEEDIESQSQALESQSTTIKIQSHFLTAAAAVIFLILGLVIVIFKSNRDKHRANSQLAAANASLAETNQRLKDTQGQLVESEKMAALGNLVAGVAHEINTPLGVSVTAASHLSDSIWDFNKLYKSGSLKRSSLENLIQDAKESTAILTRNLQRASAMIGNFKQVAADQTGEELRDFELKHYLEEVFQSLYPQLKKAGHRVSIVSDSSIQMHTYPGALAQVITNLVMNSIIHGFEKVRNGQILITAKKDDDKLLLSYQDDGKGITEEQREKIFDPFYTTKRSEGGTGLGMHICYNLITQKLEGTINVQASSSGAYFRMELPVRLNK